MDKSVFSENRVKCMLHVSPCRDKKTWTYRYFMPMGNKFPLQTRWKRADCSRICVKPADLSCTNEGKCRKPNCRKTVSSKILGKKEPSVKERIFGRPVSNIIIIPRKESKCVQMSPTTVTQIMDESNPKAFGANKKYFRASRDDLDLKHAGSKEQTMSLLRLIAIKNPSNEKLVRTGELKWKPPPRPDIVCEPSTGNLCSQLPSCTDVYRSKQLYKQIKNTVDIMKEKKHVTHANPPSQREAELSPEQYRTQPDCSPNRQLRDGSRMLAASLEHHSSLETRSAWPRATAGLPIMEKDEIFSEDDLSELCVSNIRSLASAGKTIAEDETGAGTPSALKGADRRLRLIDCPYDKSKRILYLDTDYSTSSSNVKFAPVQRTRSPYEASQYQFAERRPKLKKKKRKIDGTCLPVRVECCATPSLEEKLKNDGSSTTAFGFNSSLTNSRCAPNNHSSCRGKTSSKPHCSSEIIESNGVSEGHSKSTDIRHHHLPTTVRSAREDDGCDNSSNTGSTLSGSGSRISELRSMLRKREAEVERIRKSMKNFDDSLPG